MPKEGEFATAYPARLVKIGLELVEPYKGAKLQHSIKCLECGDIFEATPISKIQNFKKSKLTGCPQCTNTKKFEQGRQQNIKFVLNKGLEIKSPWSGARVSDKDNTPIYIDFFNPSCGHTFNCSATNILTRGITCTVCGKEERTKGINNWSKQNSEEWKKTADIWQQYKSKVTNLTKQSYKQNKDKINPTNLPTGRAGTEGAYHLDHIVPIRYCFENYIPEEICAHPDNLQMLYWTDNIGSRDKLKEYIPKIFTDLIRK